MVKHCVLFRFAEETGAPEIRKIEEAFESLKMKIPGISDFEWGLNNSPEGKTKGFTHLFQLSFRTREDRDIYLVHPDHKAFSAMAGGSLADVLVFDYEV